jgi:hypothetical protein
MVFFELEFFLFVYYAIAGMNRYTEKACLPLVLTPLKTPQTFIIGEGRLIN